jgi:hypothetical protein
MVILLLKGGVAMFWVWVLRFVMAVVGFLVGSYMLAPAILCAYVASIAKRVIKFSDDETIVEEARAQMKKVASKVWPFLVISVLISLLVILILKNYRFEYLLGLAIAVLLAIKDFKNYRDEFLYRISK